MYTRIVPMVVPVRYRRILSLSQTSHRRHAAVACYTHSNRSLINQLHFHSIFNLRELMQRRGETSDIENLDILWKNMKVSNV